MLNNFADRITQAIKTKKTPLIVGIDPVYKRLPIAITSHKEMNDEFDISSAVDATFEYCTKLMKVVAPIVPAVKLNIAYFEKYLGEGIELFYSLLSEAESLGLVVIADVKRGDIGHTADEYAFAHLKNSEYTGLEEFITADSITINGFAGTDGIEPFAKVAAEEGKGVFVWVRASNPSAAEIQDFADVNGVKMYEKLATVVDKIASRTEFIGKSGYSSIGMVVGGTTAEQTAHLRKTYDKCIFLVPGYGSQGATAKDCVAFCKNDGTGALINASRSIIYAYEKPQYKTKFDDNWEKCIEQAAIEAKIEISNALSR